MIKFIQIVVAVLVIVVGGYFIKILPSAPKIDSSVVQGEGTVINTSIGELLGSADAKKVFGWFNDESGTTNGELLSRATVSVGISLVARRRRRLLIHIYSSLVIVHTFGRQPQKGLNLA